MLKTILSSVRILHLVHNMRAVGNGIVHAAFDSATFQRKAGHDVAIASGAGEFVSALEACDVAWFDLSLRATPLDILRAAVAFPGVVRKFRPEIVHSHVPSGLLLALLFKPFFRYRVVITAHRVYGRGTRLMAAADGVIALSNVNADSLTNSGVSRKKMYIVPNGTAGSLRRKPASSEIPALRTPSIVTVAGLYLRKGIDVLIAAFEIVWSHDPRVHLYIVGEGPDRVAFEVQAQKTGAASNIHFCGFAADPGIYLNQCDVFVLASRRESFPLALLEASEAGCAIVATNVDGASEALDAGAAGILVPPDDSRALAAAIERLLNDTPAATAFRTNARTSVERFSVDKMARETLEAYATILIAGKT